MKKSTFGALLGACTAAVLMHVMLDAQGQVAGVTTALPPNPIGGALSTQLGASVLPGDPNKPDNKDLLYQTLGF